MNQVASVLLLVVLATSTIDAIAVTNCGGVDVKVDVPACTSVPCKLARGSTSEVTLEFTAPFDSNSLLASVHGNPVPSMWIAWPNFDRTVCDGDKGIQCPVSEGQKLVYKYPFHVSKNYPPIPVEAKFSMNGDNNTLVFCFQFPLRLN